MSQQTVLFGPPYSLGRDEIPLILTFVPKRKPVVFSPSHAYRKTGHVCIAVDVLSLASVAQNHPGVAAASAIERQESSNSTRLQHQQQHSSHQHKHDSIWPIRYHSLFSLCIPDPPTLCSSAAWRCQCSTVITRFTHFVSIRVPVCHVCNTKAACRCCCDQVFMKPYSKQHVNRIYSSVPESVND